MNENYEMDGSWFETRNGRKEGKCFDFIMSLIFNGTKGSTISNERF